MRKSGFAFLLAISCVVCPAAVNADAPAKHSGTTTIAQATIDSVGTGGGLIVTTADILDGYRIREYRGIVRGIMVREPSTVQSFKAGIQGMFGGKINAYIHNCELGRQGAYDAMVQQAVSRGANGIIGMRYDSDSFQGNGNDFGTEIACYGTAVTLEKIQSTQLNPPQ